MEGQREDSLQNQHHPYQEPTEIPGASLLWLSGKEGFLKYGA